MAETDLALAVAIGIQSTPGTADATIAALTDGDESDGYVLGDSESGTNGTGIGAYEFGLCEPDPNEERSIYNSDGSGSNR